MPVKVTLGFSSGRYSWTESHLDNAWSGIGQLTGQPIPPEMIALVSARVNVLGGGCSLTRMRVSNVPASRQVIDYTSSGNWAATSAYNSQPESSTIYRPLQAGPAGFCLSLLMEDAAGDETRIYLAGCPNGIFAENAPNGLGWDFTGFAQFLASLNAYIAVLTGSYNGNRIWGWNSVVGGTPYPILWPLVSNPTAYPGMIGVTSAQLLGPVGPPFIPFQVRVKGFHRLSTRSPTLSGVYWVAGIVANAGAGTYTYFLQNTGSVNPNNFLMKSNPSLLAYSPVNFKTYFQGTIDYATTRKRGASFGRARGRSPIRI